MSQPPFLSSAVPHFSPLARARLHSMVGVMDTPEAVERDTEEPLVDIYAFKRKMKAPNAVAPEAEGYILVTSGMSDRLMMPPEGFNNSETLATELLWYTRDLNLEYFAVLRWLSKLPFVNNTWFGFGHTVWMPHPPLSFCPFRHFLLLPSIAKADQRLFSHLKQQEHAIGTLVVHMLAEPEYELVKTREGLKAFLDLLDGSNYPLIFNPERKSLLKIGEIRED